MLKFFYCKKKGHFQKDCRKILSHCEKKGICLENNFVDVPNNTWWIDMGATSNVGNSLHGFQNRGKTSDGEKMIFYGI